MLIRKRRSRGTAPRANCSYGKRTLPACGSRHPWRELLPVAFRDMSNATRKMRVPPQTLPREFRLDQPAQMIGYRRVIEPLNDFVQKTGADETLGDWNRDSARARVKQLCFLDL